MKIPGLPVYVDSFGAGRTAQSPCGVAVHLLSHFHTDHTHGLHGSWADGLILCSPVTRALVVSCGMTLAPWRVVALRWGVPVRVALPGPTVERRRAEAVTLESLHAQLAPRAAVGASVPLGSSPQRTVSPNDDGLWITMLPAAHIPGSAMFIIDGAASGRVLYTGDFRVDGLACGGGRDVGADQLVGLRPLARFLQRTQLPVTAMYMDTTWLHIRDRGKAARRARDEATDPTGAPRRTGLFMSTDEFAAALEELAATVSAFDAEALRRQLAAASARPNLLNQTQMSPAVEFLPARQSGESSIGGVAAPIPDVDTSSPVSDFDWAPDDLPVNVMPPDSSVVSDTTTFMGARRFVVRVYLHNHFGKEALLQPLARRLGCRIRVDSRRLHLLRVVAEAQRAEEDDDASDRACEYVDSREWEALSPRVDLSLFYCDPEDTFASTDTAPGVIEVVARREAVTPAALAGAAAAAEGLIAFIGVALTGWAAVGRDRTELPALLNSGAAASMSGTADDHVNVPLPPLCVQWALPFSLHAPPEGAEELVRLVRPVSVRPLCGGAAPPVESADAAPAARKANDARRRAWDALADFQPLLRPGSVGLPVPPAWFHSDVPAATPSPAAEDKGNARRSATLARASVRCIRPPSQLVAPASMASMVSLFDLAADIHRSMAE